VLPATLADLLSNANTPIARDSPANKNANSLNKGRARSEAGRLFFIIYFSHSGQGVSQSSMNVSLAPIRKKTYRPRQPRRSLSTRSEVFPLLIDDLPAALLAWAAAACRSSIEPLGHTPARGASLMAGRSTNSPIELTIRMCRPKLARLCAYGGRTFSGKS
jgi:hypothetical protein